MANTAKKESGESVKLISKQIEIFITVTCLILRSFSATFRTKMNQYSCITESKVMNTYVADHSQM